MQFVTYGINHNTAPVHIRENIAFNADVLPVALASLKQHPDVIEAVIVSTCNRTEIYCYLNDDCDNIISSWLHQFHQQADGELDEFLYCYQDNDAIRHLLRVACGLDSMVLGEPQILGQIKSAYSQALNTKTLGKILGRLFQHAFTVAKQVRTDTAIGNSPVSVAFSAVSLAKQIFSNLS
ncbi:MAG: glutamyl-tRNA reductase, partial [Gammaproteobacteria bacterium]